MLYNVANVTIIIIGRRAKNIHFFFYEVIIYLFFSIDIYITTTTNNLIRVRTWT